MNIGGYQQTSLIDYPGKIAAVVFTTGCNFRCPYCHNKDLVLHPERLPSVPEEDIFSDLESRKKWIDGVVLTGGEPTLQEDLLGFVKKIKELGLLVKLDTNGANTSALLFEQGEKSKVLERSEGFLHSAVVNDLFDYVALDVKAPLDYRYRESVGLENFDVSSILHSMKELANSDIDYELRTTVVPTLHSEEDLLDLARQLSKVAPQAKWVLQNFQPKNCLDPEFEKIKPYDRAFFENLLPKLMVDIPKAQLRQ